jgi:TfoX/Sxy family transcriptional regulator of competence genes
VAYDEGLAERLREVVADDERISERKMFGGLAFLCAGNMAFGIIGDELMVRVGADAWEQAAAEAHAREMDFTGKPMKGMVYVAVEGIAEDDDLRTWVGRGLDFAGSLPPKAPTP